MGSKYFVPVLLALALYSCSESPPKTEGLVAAIEERGVALSEPAGMAGGSFGDLKRAVNANAGGARPQVTILESPGGVMVTIYRFESEGDAVRLKNILAANVPKISLPKRFEQVLGREERLQHKNFVVTMRFREAARDEMERISAAIGSL